jgi:hypothetical protein
MATAAIAQAIERDAFYAAQAPSRRPDIMAALDFAIRVNALLVARGLRTRGQGAMLSPDENRALDVAYQSGQVTPEQFVDLLAATQAEKDGAS